MNDPRTFEEITATTMEEMRELIAMLLAQHLLLEERVAKLEEEERKGCLRI